MPGDAEATVRFAFLDAIAETYGQPPERLVDALVQRLEDSSTRWAFQELVAPRE